MSNVNWDLFGMCKKCQRYKGDISEDMKIPKCHHYAPSVQVSDKEYKIIVSYEGCKNFMEV